MSVCLVLAHPEEKSLSYQIFHELSSLLQSSGDQVYKQDLYREEFDPVLSLDEIKRRMSFDPLVSRYARELSESDHVILIHPDWWGGPPAMMKGWVDRVLRPGTAYDEIQDFPGDDPRFYPLLESKKISLIVLSHRDVSSEGLRRFWQDDVFAWCGADDFQLFHLKGMGEKSDNEIADWKRTLIQSFQSS